MLSVLCEPIELQGDELLFGTFPNELGMYVSFILGVLVLNGDKFLKISCLIHVGFHF